MFDLQRLVNDGRMPTFVCAAIRLTCMSLALIGTLILLCDGEGSCYGCHFVSLFFSRMKTTQSTVIMADVFEEEIDHAYSFPLVFSVRPRFASRIARRRVVKSSGENFAAILSTLPSYWRNSFSRVFAFAFAG